MKLPELFIVGAGGFGRELLGWIKDLPEWENEWSFAGFLDDDSSALDGFDYDAQVVAPISGFTPKSDQFFACGIGNVAVKRKACCSLLERGVRFMTIVHPKALVGSNVTLGQGVVICPGVTLTCDIQVGEMAMINLHSTVGHDASIGSWSTLSAHCDLTGGVQVGAGVFLGSGARILPGKSVGDDAVVGAGSVVIRDVKAGNSVFGNPARVLS